MYKTIHIQGNSIHIRSFFANHLKYRRSKQYSPYVRSEWIRHKPDTVYDKPDTVYDKPDTVYNRPDAVYNKPNTVYDKPDTVYDKPDAVYNKPDATGCTSVVRSPVKSSRLRRSQRQHLK